MLRSFHSLLKSVGISVPIGLEDSQIENLSSDSRLIKRGDLFIGLPGENVDGGIFWPKALKEGALAAVISRKAAQLRPPGANENVIVLPDPLPLWAGELAAEFWGRPSSKISLIGVTGTNGKTTTSHIIEHLCQAVGRKTALFGTLVNRWPLYNEVAIHTTGVASTLQGQLAQSYKAGVEFGVMEVSSHALVQRRIAGCSFSGAIFTNLTQDHLDYHSSMEEYFEAKALLFEPSFFRNRNINAVVNVENQWGKLLSKRLRHNCWDSAFFSRLENGKYPELFFSDLQMNADGATGRIHTPVGNGSFVSPLMGKFNLMNLLQAVGILVQLGLPLDDLLGSISTFKGVPGRMQRIELFGEVNMSTLPRVFVDYAHTPDGLKNALVALKPFTNGALICVFGCGGDRDRGKRAKMGAIAAKFADKLVLTSDNPRTEDPKVIIDDIKGGVADEIDMIINTERSAAIQIAISNAAKGDVILIAGKGHEDYQIIGGDKIHFDDREEATNVLRKIIDL